MSFNIEVLGGKNYLLPTGGKYCPQDIAIAAIGGNEGMYCWAKFAVPPYKVPMDKVVTKNMTIAEDGGMYTIKSTSGSSGWGVNRLDMPLVKRIVFYPNDISLYMQIGVMKDSNTINQGQANFGMAFYTDGGVIKHHRKGAYVASYGTFALSDVFTIEFTDTEMQVYKNGALLFTDNTFNSDYTKLSFECYQGSATIGTFKFGEEATPIGYTVSNEENAYPDDGYADDGYYYTNIGVAHADMVNALNILGVEV